MENIKRRYFPSLHEKYEELGKGKCMKMRARSSKSEEKRGKGSRRSERK